MKPEINKDKSIFQQIAENIEDDILKKVIDEESQAPSSNQLAAMYRINPATAAKGLNLLVDEGTLYKMRGIGMFVSRGAANKIKSKRRKAFRQRFVTPMLEEAHNLEIGIDDVLAMINKIR